MNLFGDFLASLRTSAGLPLEDLAVLADSSKSTISRLENEGVSYPLRSTVRKQIISLAEILCGSPKDSERYLDLLGMRRSHLTEAEEVQLGFIPVIQRGIAEEEHDLIRLQHIYEQRLTDLGERAARIKRVPACLEIKLRHYTDNLNEIKERLEHLHNRKKLPAAKALQLSPANLITESLILLNFAHPLTESQKASIEELTGVSLDKILDIPTYINEAEPLAPQIADLLDSINLTHEEWHACHILVNPPGYAPAAFLLLAAIHGRSGHFPVLVRLRPVQGSLTTYEVAEIINLQAVRDAARASHNGSSTSHRPANI
jgi:transcriptional regulator with XRE-family HTH domain